MVPLQQIKASQIGARAVVTIRAITNTMLQSQVRASNSETMMRVMEPILLSKSKVPNQNLE